MVAIRRIALILAAFALGNFFAVNILSAGKILVEPSNWSFYSKWDYAGGGLAGYALHLFVGTIGSMIEIFIPTLFALIFAEMLRIQSKWFYVLTAGIGAFLLDVTCTRVPITGGMRSFCVEASLSELLIVTVAGIAAGFVFWSVAGKSAGRWRADMSLNRSLAA
jgi:hypothetical protein